LKPIRIYQTVSEEVFSETELSGTLLGNPWLRTPLTYLRVALNRIEIGT
jgi:hypothetical protein